MPPTAPSRPPQAEHTIICGDSEHALDAMADVSVDLVFTSPPYFNARRDCAVYDSYEQFLAKIGRVVAACHRLLAEGRFLVVNSAPVIEPRSTRQATSRRLAVPFDLHPVICGLGFDFVDDIVWAKPSGAGVATWRGARFAADRQPLQYKPAPVTEYVMVYRKHTDKLIDWNLRNCRDPRQAPDSLIGDDYETTNIWELPPAKDNEHPAVFPAALADRVVSYYSFRGDVVLDPFAGSGTVGASCARLGRRFVLVDNHPGYIDTIKDRAGRWLGKSAEDVACVGTPPIRTGMLL